MVDATWKKAIVFLFALVKVSRSGINTKLHRPASGVIFRMVKCHWCRELVPSRDGKSFLVEKSS